MARPDRLASQLVDTSLRFLHRRPWDLLPADAVFLIQVPTEQHSLAAMITGRDGVELGMMLSRGPDGLQRSLRVVYAAGPGESIPDHLIEGWDQLAVCFEPLMNIGPEHRGVLDRADFRGRRETLAPLLYAKRPGQESRRLTRQEMRTLLWCLLGVLGALDADELELTTIERGQPFVRLDVSGSVSRPEVRQSSVAWETAVGPDEFLGTVVFPGEGRSSAAASEYPLVENPTTLDEWKAADLQFTAFLASHMAGNSEVITPRAMARFFGGVGKGDKVLDELRELCPHISLVEWIAADYRPTRRSKTWLEKYMARGSIPEVHRDLARARLEAELSIYRVDRTEPGQSLDVEDVYSGRRLTLHDKSLSGCAIEGVFLPMRLMQVGQWIFPLALGPALSSLLVHRAMESLQAAGLPRAAKGLRDHAQLMGRLWSWFLDERDVVPTLQNTDGDPLLWHTASFSVAAPGDLLAALAARDDMVCDEPGSEWTWLRDGEGVAGFGDSLTLCRLELIGDELLVEANSARRMALAREWVDALPGVSYQGQTTREVGQEAEQRPLDDRLPSAADRPRAPTPPELVAELKRIVEEKNRSWLDESVPALGGLTPRQACATESGRAAVERMIRTMPAAGYPGGTIEPARDELLAELGLGAPEPDGDGEGGAASGGQAP